jgi:AcrR family transcriptional regulator
MFTKMKKRKYQQKRRAEQAQATRRQIVEAAVFLHEKLGPARTSIKAVAEQAGVQRLTVYRHFPDEASLFNACTLHWFSLHPPPDMVKWADIRDPADRSHRALLLFCRYYRQTGSMWQVAYRDVDELEALQAPMAVFETYLDQVCDDLLGAWQPDKKCRKVLAVTIRHGLRFDTWQSLQQAKLKDGPIADLLLQWISGVRVACR